MRVFAVLIALLLAACQTTEDRGGGANILIMGEDANPDTVPRGSRVFSQVLDALANELIDEGFDVYDETAAARMRRSSTSPAPFNARPLTWR